MEKLVFKIQVKDEFGRLYQTQNGHPVGNFKVESEPMTVNRIKKYCEVLNYEYKAIAKEGSLVDISVEVFNNISDTYMCLFSLYDYNSTTEFIQHN